jgi:hypothetical protein
LKSWSVIEQAGWEEFISKVRGETFDGIGAFGFTGTFNKFFEHGIHWHVFSLVGCINTVTTGLVFNINEQQRVNNSTSTWGVHCEIPN